MTHFLLIHGSWHGAWCWYKIAPRLQAEGHRVSVVNLPGRGRDVARPVFISLKRMVRHTAAMLPDTGKTTVVVHSRYGILASRLAELVPDKIERTIYLASFMLPANKAAASYFRADRDSLIGPSLQVSKLGMWDFLRPEAYREALYHDCSDDDNMLGQLLLCPEPLRPAVTRLTLTGANYGRVPRAYIRLTQDRAVSLSLQDRLLNETKVDRVESIDASHSAYFSKPDALTQTILKLAGS